MTRSRFGRPFVVVGSVAVFAVLPAFALAVVVWGLAEGEAGWALREAFLPAADAVTRGESPYPHVDDPSVARGSAYVYPPLLAQVLVPFTLLPQAVAVVVFALLLAAAAGATLAVLGVRDWRCYGLVLLWPPVLSAIHVENVSIVMALAAALVWRLRERLAGGVALGVSMAVKPLLWPLAPWLLAARSFAVLATGIAVGAGVALASWAAIGFAGLLEYRELVRRLGEHMDEWGYSAYALALDLGAGETLARLVWVALAVGLLGASYAVTRRGDSRRGFVLAVAAAIACSPIVWLHYFALLLVVVAVAQPTLGVAWLPPFLMYGAEEIGNGTPAQTALTLVAAALTVAVALRVAPRVRRAGLDEPGLYDPGRRITVTRSSA